MSTAPTRGFMSPALKLACMPGVRLLSLPRCSLRTLTEPSVTVTTMLSWYFHTLKRVPVTVIEPSPACTTKGWALSWLTWK